MTSVWDSASDLALYLDIPFVPGRYELENDLDRALQRCGLFRDLL